MTYIDMSPSMARYIGGPDMLLIAVLDWLPWALLLVGIALFWVLSAFMFLRINRRLWSKKQ